MAAHPKEEKHSGEIRGHFQIEKKRMGVVKTKAEKGDVSKNLEQLVRGAKNKEKRRITLFTLRA